MGTCCCSRNRPSEKFVGIWTDNKYVELTIHEDGNINYRKQTEHTNGNFNGPSRFKEDGFFYCCCCCCVRGRYFPDENSEPKLIANGTVLTRK